MENVNKIKPSGLFTNYIFKTIPLAFDESMSYYETLCGLLAYLRDTVIPAVDNNANAIIEVQNLMTQLQNYVDHYFDNLDVQEEINNKLDEMAENGQLTDIIAQYLQLAGVLAYDTKTAMKTATNLVNGSIAKTLGNTSYSDGQGAFYKVRQVQNTDVIDDDNIIALSDPDLVAQKILYSSGYDLQTQINTISTNLSNLDSNILTDLVVIGDSYTAFSSSNWAENLASQLHLTLHKHAQSSMGFAHDIDGDVFTDLLDWEDTSFYNKVKYVICYGGINDYDQTRSNIQTGVSNFITKAKTNFPNAQIIIAGPQKDKNVSTTNTTRNETERCAMERACMLTGVAYVNASDWLINTEFPYTMTYDNDGLHPSATGYTIITGKFLEIINNNINEDVSMTISLNDGLTGTLYVKQCKNYVHFETKITNITITQGVYTTILNIDGFADVPIEVNLDGYVDNKKFMPVFKINSSNNAEAIIGGARIGVTNSKHIINFVSWASTFTGDIAVEGDIYFNMERKA